MNVPNFIDIGENDQIAEIRSYLRGVGADISEEHSSNGLVGDLDEILLATPALWTEATSDPDLECLYNSISSLVFLLAPNKGERIVEKFCEQLSKSQPGDKRNIIRLKILSNLLHGLEDKSLNRLTVYLTLVKLAGKADLMHLITPQLGQIKNWLSTVNLETNQTQAWLTTLHTAYLDCKQTDRATLIMVELLATYGEDTASQARDSAIKCVISCLADTNTYLFDHLLLLKPVKFLEGQPIHELLTIFVTGKLSQYLQFYEKNKDFINNCGLNHEQNMQKMRLLTFMQMAETNIELDFESIHRELKLDPDDVESFIIDAVRSKTVLAKIDQLNHKVLINSTTHRTFGRPQWQALRDSLTRWQQSLDAMTVSLQNVNNMQALNVQ